MKGKLTHFAIYIDDIERAKKFYDGVFEWGFNSYGQSDFLQIEADKTGNGELIGALQSRNYSPVPDKIICTIGVYNRKGKEKWRADFNIQNSYSLCWLDCKVFGHRRQSNLCNAIR